MTLGQLSGLSTADLGQIGNAPTMLRELSQCATELEEAGKILVGLEHPGVGGLFTTASVRVRTIIEEAKAACPCEQASSAQTAS